MTATSETISFVILGETITLISEPFSFGLNTVAEIGNKYHYLGDEPATISSAIFAWQEFYHRELSVEQLRQVMKDNHLL